MSHWPEDIVEQLARELDWTSEQVAACLEEAEAAGLIVRTARGLQATIPDQDTAT